MTSFKEAAEVIKNHVGSSRVTSNRRKLKRNRMESHEKLVKYYFTDDVVFDRVNFEGRFQMRRELFLRIVGDIENSTPYFEDDYYASCRKSFTPLQKCSSVIRQLAYGKSPDSLSEYLHMS